MEHEITVTVQLNDRCSPLDRGDLYEDPLSEALEAEAVGEVTGGGTLLSPNGEIAFCDLEVLVRVDLDAALSFIREKLEALGAPRGSKLIVDDRELNFGISEGLAFYFNITDVPEEVQEAYPLNDLANEFREALDGLGEMHGSWVGQQEVGVYFFGSSFDKMREKLMHYPQTHPRCRNARIVQVA